MKKSGLISPKEKAEIRRLDAEGLSASDIAAVIGRGPGIVAMLLKATRAKAIEAPAPEPVPEAPEAVADQSTPAIQAAPEVELKGENLRIWQHLDALGYSGGFDAELDYDLVAGLGAGTKLAQLALDLDRDAEALKARFEDAECRQREAEEEARDRRRPNPGDGNEGRSDDGPSMEYRDVFHRFLRAGGDMVELSSEDRGILRGRTVGSMASGRSGDSLAVRASMSRDAWWHG